MIVLDTNVLSEPMRAAPDESVLAWLEQLREPAAITAVTVGELLGGVGRLPAGRRRDALGDAIEGLLEAHRGAILPYDDRAARVYAGLQERRRRAGHPLSVEDGMIAAICLVAGATLATRNTADFSGLGLELVDPWRP